MLPPMRAPFLLTAAMAASAAFAQPAATQDLSAPHTVTGRVVTPFAELVAGANVTLTGGPPPGRSQTTTTDAQGLFRFEGLPGGQYALAAARDGFTMRQILPEGQFREEIELRLVDGDRLP